MIPLPIVHLSTIIHSYLGGFTILVLGVTLLMFAGWWTFRSRRRPWKFVSGFVTDRYNGSRDKHHIGLRMYISLNDRLSRSGH